MFVGEYGSINGSNDRREMMKVGGPVSNKKGWDALYSLTESL
jgi:hypothetical protein